MFKSENNGTTFEPVFETYGTASIGDIAIHPTQSRTSSTSAPASRTTARPRRSATASTRRPTAARPSRTSGCKETQTIARIVIDPKNPETVYVASPGHLFGPNPERGVYKTTDGGKTWNKIKFIDDDTGFTDIVIDPSNTQHPLRGELSAPPQRLLLQRRRSRQRASGRATDAGKTWTKLTGNGLPPGTYGRIALDVSRSNPNVVYAQIEAGETGTPERRPVQQTGGDRSDARRRRGGHASGGGTPQRRPGARGATRAAAARAAGGGSAAAVAAGAAATTGATTPARAAASAVAAAAVAAAAAGGHATPPPRSIRTTAASSAPRTRAQTWTLVSNCNSRPMYFSQLRVDPINDKTIYVAGLPVAKSLDGGKTFATLDEAGGNGEPGHVDQHAIWIDPKNPKHIMIGNDGGLNISWDQGKTWDFVNTMATALAYCRHAPTCGGPYYVYIGPAGQRQLGRPERDARPRRHHELRLVRHRRRRRILHRRRSDRLQHRHTPNRRTATTNRYDLRGGRGASIRPTRAAGAAGAARRRRTRQRARRRQRRRGDRRAPERRRRRRCRSAARAVRRPRRHAERAQRGAGRQPIASTGTRRSSCRRTTRSIV